MNTVINTNQINVPPYWGWTAYTPTIPKLYWDVYSQEERIKRLCVEYDKLTHYSSMLAEHINELDEAVSEELKKTLNEVNNAIKNLEEEWKLILAGISESGTDWDVQHGYATSSVDAMRDMFNDVTIHGITIKELNELNMTVEGLANCGLNVRGLAVIGYNLINDNKKDFNNNGFYVS